MIQGARRAALGLALSAVLVGSSSASAQVPELPEVIVRDGSGVATIRTLRTPSPIIVDGQLEEAVYRDVKPFGEFVQQEPFEGKPSTERTEVWVFFDDKNVYVSARLWETEPGRRVTSDMRRDASNMYNNDHFGVLFDTFKDGRNAFGFSANSQGGMFDWQVTNEQPSNNWNGLWNVRAADFEGGWSVEFVIPFRSMRFKEGTTSWGINFRRMVRWRNEVSYLSPVPLAWGRRGLSKVSSAGPLVGIEVPSKLRNLDIKPYALGSNATNKLATPAIDNDLTAEFGVDAKWGITQQLFADFTYNTDFAQVEDDEAQVNLTRFSVLFPEKRDFFLEGQDVFNFAGAGSNQGGGGIPLATQSNPTNNTPVVFFSRRIGLQGGAVVPILAGARMLGRGDAFQMGAVHMRTEEGLTPGSPATDFSVFRFNKDVLSRSRIGAIATRRGPGIKGDENYAYGVDATFNPHNNLAITSYWAGTQDTSAPECRRSSELSRTVQLERRPDRPAGRPHLRGRRVQPGDRLPASDRVRPHLRLHALQPAAEELEGRPQGVLRGQRRLLREHGGHAGVTRDSRGLPHGVHLERSVGHRVLQSVRAAGRPFRRDQGRGRAAG